MVVLDSFDISTIEGLSQEKTERADQLMSSYNPNPNREIWNACLEGPDRRFVPINGALSPAQLAWLEETLGQAALQGETVVVLCHVPLHPRAADNKYLLWNYQVAHNI